MSRIGMVVAMALVLLVVGAGGASLAEGGEIEQAFEATLNEALAQTQNMNQEMARSGLQRDIALALFQAQELTRALEVTGTITDPFYRAWTLIDLAWRVSEKGDEKMAMSLAQDALEIARKIPDGFKRSWKLVDVANLMFFQGKYEDAFSILKDALATAKTIGNDSERVTALTEIAKAMAENAYSDEALAVCDEAIPVARTIKDERSRNRALTALTEVLTTVGELEKALSVAREITDPLERLKALASVMAER